MTDELVHVVKWHNGSKEWSPFSDAEMSRRQNDLRGYMAKNNIDAALMTSYHNICYYSGFLYCYFGRKYGMVITAKDATTITAASTAASPGAAPSATTSPIPIGAGTISSRAVQQLTKGAKRIGVELDHISVDYSKQIEDALPGVELVDIAQPAMWMRSIKSAEEHKLIREGRAHLQCRRPRRDGRDQGRRARA